MNICLNNICNKMFFFPAFLCNGYYPAIIIAWCTFIGIHIVVHSPTPSLQKSASNKLCRLF